MDELALVPQNITAVQLFTENGLDPILDGIKKKIAEFVPDVETAKGRKEIASFAYKIAQSKTFIDEAGKKLVEKQKAEIKLIDAERKRARDFLDLKKVEVRQPLTDYEEAEKARIEAEILETQKQADWDSAIAENELFKRRCDLERREAELKRIEDERKAKEEAERIEKERIEREERLKKEAAEQAKREAEVKIKEAEERLERERADAKRKEEAAKEAALKAERDRIAAEERAKIEKEMAIRKATEEAEARAKTQKEAEEREATRIRAEEEKRAANKKHKAAVNNVIKKELMTFGLEESVAEEIIVAIATGRIKPLYIQY